MNLPDTLKFIPGFRHSPESGFVETLPKIELPNGDALLINGYSAHCKVGEDTPTLEERNAISAELVARWNAKARLKVADPDALPKGVCIVLYRRGGLFAVSQRLSTCGHAGMWQFPGGHVEPGEAPLDAAIRELREETGLEIASHRFLHIGTTKPLVGYKGETYVVYRYGVTLDERMVADIGNPEPHKHTSWRWVNHRTLLELDMLQETKPYALEYALNCETSR